MKKISIALIILSLFINLISCTSSRPADTGLDTRHETSVIIDFSTDTYVYDATTEAKETQAPELWDEKDNLNVRIKTTHAGLMNAETGEILYMSGGYEKIYPASMTKLLTSLYALSVCDSKTVFSPGDELELVAEDSSLAYIRPGHSLSLEMLVEGMLLPSGNDAAYVAAAGIGRMMSNEEGINAKEAVNLFMNGLNEYALSLGLKNTHFTAPDGYHDDEHYTTVEDMLKICKYALENDIIAKYASTHHDEVTYASGHKNEWTNSNLLIDESSKYFYKYATGLKTGTTDEAGYCLSASAKKDGVTLVACVFNAPTSEARFEDPIKLFKAGFKSFS